MFHLKRYGIGILLCMLMLEPARAVEIPPALAEQVERVAGLLRDPYATEYPDARMMQRTRNEDDDPITLVVFTLEGFGGGNNHTQYLAAFELESREAGRPHYRLLDVIPIGGKGWRSVNELAARTNHDPRLRETRFSLDVLENTPKDAMNFPTKPVVVTIMLKDGRLTELP